MISFWCNPVPWQETVVKSTQIANF